MQPRHAFLCKDFAPRLKLFAGIERADVYVDFRREPGVLAADSRAASSTESALHAGRRFEFCNFAVCHLKGGVFVGYERRGWRTAVLPATFTMAPKNPFRLSAGDEANCFAEASTLEPVVHVSRLRASVCKGRLYARLLPSTMHRWRPSTRAG